jgi:hypothetical protein
MLSRAVRAFGMIVRIDTDAADLFALLDRRLPAFPPASPHDRPDGSGDPMRTITYRVGVRRTGGTTVLRGRRTLATTPDVPAAADVLVTDLQTALARRALDVHPRRCGGDR